MPTCAHCETKWSYKDALKGTLRMTCPYCGQKNYQSAKSRMKSMFITVLLAPVISMFGTFIKLPILWTLFVVLLFSLAILFIFPFFTELSQEEEPYW